MIEVIPTVAMQNNRNATNSTIVVWKLYYRAQVDVLCVNPAAALLPAELLPAELLPTELAGPLLHVGQEAELPAVLGNDDTLVLEHVGQ